MISISLVQLSIDISLWPDEPYSKVLCVGITPNKDNIQVNIAGKTMTFKDI